MKQLQLIILLLFAMHVYAQDDKNYSGNEISLASQQHEKDYKKNDYRTINRNGWVKGDDIHILLDPDTKTYGFRFSGEAREWIHFALGANYVFGGFHPLTFYTGIGPGVRYEFNPFLV